MELLRSPQPARFSRAQLVLGLYGALALAGVLVGWYRGGANIYLLPGTRPQLLRLLVSPLCGAVVGLWAVFLSRLAVHRFEWARVLHRGFRGLLGPLTLLEI